MSGRSHTPLHEIEARRIALIKPSALGDIVHSLPVLSALRSRFPAAQITWVVNRGYEPLLQGHPHLDATLPFDRSVHRRGPLAAGLGYMQFARELNRRRFDLVVDLQGLLRTGLMAMATGAGRRVGLSTAREGAECFYTDTLVAPGGLDGMHAVDRYWRVAEAFGVGETTKRFVVPVSDEARAWADAQLASLPRPLIMLGAGSRWQTKRWLPEHFAALAGRATARWGGSVVLVGSPDEKAIALAVRNNLSGPTLDLTGATTLPRLAGVLARADVLVANDTGPLHLAAALGRPVVSPYTCTKLALTGPYGSRGGVESKIWCQGSYLKRCSRMECMGELTPDRLWPALAEVLQTWDETASRSA